MWREVRLLKQFWDDSLRQVRSPVSQESPILIAFILPLRISRFTFPSPILTLLRFPCEAGTEEWMHRE